MMNVYSNNKEELRYKMKKKKIILTITKIFFAILASTLIGYNLFLINAQAFLKEKLPMPLGLGTAVVVSNSMFPYLEINDLIIVEKTNDYEVGDVIVYDDGHVLVVHRIVEIDEYTFVAKGDANDSNDRPYSVDLIKGEVVKIIPEIGIMQEVIANPFVQISSFVIAIVLFELSFKLDSKEKPKENEELKKEIELLKEELKYKE